MMTSYNLRAIVCPRFCEHCFSNSATRGVVLGHYLYAPHLYDTSQIHRDRSPFCGVDLPLGIRAL